MIDKRVQSIADAFAGVGDGSTVMIGGFGVGQPLHLIDGLIDQARGKPYGSVQQCRHRPDWARSVARAEARAQDRLLIPAHGGPGRV